MHSKKMWQTLLILFLFLFVSALLAWAAGSLLKAAKWQLVFGIGAGLGSVLTCAAGYKAIWLCCVLLFISFCMMFVPEKDM